MLQISGQTTPSPKNFWELNGPLLPASILSRCYAHTCGRHFAMCAEKFSTLAALKPGAEMNTEAVNNLTIYD